ncbi:MAG: carboxypeptidase regulatory-like domain-containing protein [Planctomycetes bacterium]|nr:carboxypeptidase regulatory-like domain-containing protein [Planctomycetota bacterium]
MPRTALCVLCALLAALAAAAALLGPSPAAAQEVAKGAVTIGTGEKPVGTIRCTVRMLGADAALAEFKLLTLARFSDGTLATHEALTTEDGQLVLTLLQKPAELRVFAFGEYTVPDAWATLPLQRMSFEKEESWEVRVRPLRNVRLSGKVTIGATGKPAPRANVMIAPLDVAQDGTTQLFDQPLGTMTAEDGTFSMDLPTGYYSVWSYWADRSGDDWIGHIKVVGKLDLFGERTLDMAVLEGPVLKGKVVDARTGEGLAANIDLYSNQYLRQLRNPTADGQMADEYDAQGNEVIWPVGTFKVRAWMVDPEDFTAVIRPQGNDRVLKVIPNLKASELAGKEIIWKLYTEDMPVLDVSVVTHKHDLPVNELDVQLLPKKIEAPAHIRQSYTAGGITGERGELRFIGLAPGKYEAYGARGSVLLGELEVTRAAAQTATLKFEIPFAVGTVKLADGTACRNLVVFIRMVNAEGREFGPFSSDAFRDNPVLREQGKVFVPLTQRGATFKLVFAAMEGGRAFKEEEWAGLSAFHLATDEVSFKVDSEEAFAVDLTLKANPQYKKEG